MELRGRDSSGRWWTDVAASFPRPFADAWARESVGRVAEASTARGVMRSRRRLLGLGTRMLAPLLLLGLICCCSAVSPPADSSLSEPVRRVGIASGLPLRSADLRAATQEKYASALAKFWRWLTDQALHPVQTYEYDDCLELYINDLFVRGGGRMRSLASLTYAALLRRHPRLKGCLRASFAALKSWARAAPSSSYKPLPWGAVLLMVRFCENRGWWIAATALVVAFKGLLRVGELLRLRAADVYFKGSEVVLRLMETKTGKDQPVRIGDTGVIWALRWLLSSLPRGALLFEIPYYRLRAQFKTALQQIGLPPHAFVLHSLRHGGATEAFLAGMPLDNVAHLGRWRSLTTARRYVQLGAALLGEARLNQRMLAVSENLVQRWPWQVGPARG